MRKSISLLILTAALATLAACDNDIAGGEINVEFAVESMVIDLNKSNNPSVTCMVTSEVGLRSVSMYVLYEGGVEEAFKTPITDFFNDGYCSIFEKPSYRQDMTGFKVVARDLGGNVAEGTVDFEVIAMAGAPVIDFDGEGISFAEGDPIPDFSFTVTSEAPLATVTVELIQSGEPLNLLDAPIDSFTDPLNFVFDSGDYTLVGYDINKLPTAIRVTATDNYGKISISLLPITYAARPSPELTITTTGPLTVDEYSTGNTVAGSTSSETGIVEIEYLFVGDDYEVSAGKETFATPKTEYDFSYSFGGDDLREYVTAIVVAAKDARNKIKRRELALTVNPMPTLVKSGDNLRAVIDAQMADGKFRSVKLMLEASDTGYSLGSSALVPSKPLSITGQNGSKPKISTSVNPVVDISSVNIDYLRFENVELSGSAQNFINQASSGNPSIGEVTFEGCILRGYTTSLLRTAGTTIGNIAVDDCILYWANTGSGSALFQITQSADRIGKLTFTNSTVYKALYFIYGNMNNIAVDVTIASSTFVNSMATSGGYFVSFQNSGISGTVDISKTLFGGSTNLTSASGFRMLRKNNVAATTTDNYCTPTWKQFTDDTANGSVNFLSTLPVDNAALFTDPAGDDWTIKNTTSVVYTGRIGDPRWLP